MQNLIKTPHIFGEVMGPRYKHSLRFFIPFLALTKVSYTIVIFVVILKGLQQDVVVDSVVYYCLLPFVP